MNPHPLILLELESVFTLRSETVVLSSTTALRTSPPRDEQSLVFKAMKYGIEHAVLPVERTIRQFPDMSDNLVSVTFPGLIED